jgi:hypothetical protein
VARQEFDTLAGTNFVKSFLIYVGNENVFDFSPVAESGLQNVTKEKSVLSLSCKLRSLPCFYGNEGAERG